MKVLAVKRMSKLFGGLTAVDNLSFEVGEKELVGLIGPNGSGKTTALNCIAGFYPPTRGEIIFKGENIAGLKPQEVAASGLGRTFQLTSLFPEVNVFECVMTALHMKVGTSFWEIVMRTTSRNKKENIARSEALGILEFLELTSEKDKLCGTISNYSRKRLVGKHDTSTKLLFALWFAF